MNSVNIDSKKGTVTIVGDIDLTKLMQRFEKMGRTAEVWFFEKSPSQDRSSSYNKKKVQFSCDDDEEEEEEEEEDGDDFDDEYMSRKSSASHTTMNGNKHGQCCFGKRGSSIPPSSSSRFYRRTPQGAFRRTPRPTFQFPWIFPNPSRYLWGFSQRPLAPPPPLPLSYGYGYGYESGLERVYKPITHYTNYWDNYRLSP